MGVVMLTDFNGCQRFFSRTHGHPVKWGGLMKLTPVLSSIKWGGFMKLTPNFTSIKWGGFMKLTPSLSSIKRGGFMTISPLYLSLSEMLGVGKMLGCDCVEVNLCKHDCPRVSWVLWFYKISYFWCGLVSWFCSDEMARCCDFVGAPIFLNLCSPHLRL